MPTNNPESQPEPTCFFSVVRYVADPIRDEARNIGVLVVAPDRSFAGAKFNLAKLHLAAGSERLRYLREMTGAYQRRLPSGTVTDRAVTTREFLDGLHAEATNVIQFSVPSVAIGSPQEVLESTYKERVAEPGGGGATFGRSDAQSAMARSLRQAGIMAEALVPTPWVDAGGDSYVFDIGVRNGAWLSVVEVLSFRKADTLRVEHEGAWFARVFPIVRDEHGLSGHVFVERPSAPGEGLRRFDRVRGWVEDAGGLTHEPGELPAVADEIARSVVAHAHQSQA